MKLVIIGGSSHPTLAKEIRKTLGAADDETKIEHFPDGELHVQVREDVRGADVFLIQSTGAPVGEHLIELLLLADACRAAGAATLTAVIPYFGYARQDRRSKRGEPLGARVMIRALESVRWDRIVAVDLHSPAIEGGFVAPVEHVSAVPMLAEKIRPHVGPDSIIVAPDLGAGKLARRFSRLLNLPLALIHKTRLSDSDVSAQGVIGEVRGSKPIIVDDLIATGGTICAAAEAAVAQGCQREITVVATHAPLTTDGVERLRRIPITHLFTSDSVVPRSDHPLPHTTVPLAPLFAEVIARLSKGEPLGELVFEG